MNKLKKYILLGITFMFTCQIGFSQTDSTIFSYNDFLKNIIQFHPIAKQANLKVATAKAEKLAAKGGFDPIIATDWNQKNFDDKIYYRQYQANLKFPTPLGIDFIGGYENTEGVYLNPENKTDNYGLWFGGVELNVLQGFLVNEKRTALQQAKVAQELANNERQLILNDLVYNASIAYLKWQQYQYYNEVLTENLSIATTYFENTKQAYWGGEKTAIDTLEAFILYQDAVSYLLKNEMGLEKARQMIENYMWLNENPVPLQPQAKPEYYLNEIFPQPTFFNDENLSSHPAILSAINKLSVLEIEQKLKREKLKPKLKLKYNPLLATSPNSVAPSFSIKDFKWGFDFSMPLLLRSERGAIQKGEIKIQETEINIDNKRNELLNKIQNSWQQKTLLQEQIALLSNNVENYKRLMDGENEKFKYGESSVFLLNKRQEKYINGQLRLIETHIKQQIELLNYLYFTNQLVN